MQIEWRGLHKSFGRIPVLRNMTDSIRAGEMVVLSGVSGSGKSTLLNILGLIETPDRGEIVWWGKKNVKPFSHQAEKILAQKIGYLFQDFALINHMTVEQNLDIALEMIKASRADKQTFKRVALAEVGLEENFLEKRIFECSGGEQQRIAIARLLLKPCEMILCDEPTGSLDEGNKEIVIGLLRKLQKSGKSIVIATHDNSLKEIADKVIVIPDLKLGA